MAFQFQARGDQIAEPARLPPELHDAPLSSDELCKPGPAPAVADQFARTTQESCEGWDMKAGFERDCSGLRFPALNSKNGERN